MKNFISYLKDDEGISTVEVLVITAVLVVIALVFRDKLKAFIGIYFTKIEKKAYSFDE